MCNRVTRLLKNGIIIIFLILLTVVSFEKEKSIAQSQGKYADTELDAEIISHTAPERIGRTQTCQINITVKNCGKAVWSAEDNIALCIWQDDVDWGFRAQILDGVQVQGGECYTFVLDGFSISDKSKTKLEFQMVKEKVTYFGDREGIEIIAVE